MRFDLEIDGRELDVSIPRPEGAVVATVGGTDLPATITWLDEGSLLLLVGGRSYEVQTASIGSDRLEVHVDGRIVNVDFAGPTRSRQGGRSKHSSGSVEAPMPGKVVALLVDASDMVSEGQGVVVLEAMKMENEIQAPIAGRVKAIHVQPGLVIEAGTVMVEIEPC